jgi:hypothetical protein
MPDGPSTTDASLVRSQVREAEHAARRLIIRAAHLEKLARRPRVSSAERISLEGRARDLRATADALLTEVSELSKQVNVA